MHLWILKIISNAHAVVIFVNQELYLIHIVLLIVCLFVKEVPIPKSKDEALNMLLFCLLIYLFL
jgi:hypothetical protein